MRIVHLDTGQEMRGGQRQVLLLARGLRERGHEQVVLARAGGPLLAAAAEAGLEARPIGATAVAREARPASLLHAHDARSHTLAAVLAGSCPLVVSRRVAFPVKQGPLSRWKYQRAAHYLAVSEFVKQRLAEAGIPVERISVVYDGVEARGTITQGERRPLAVAPGTGDPQKGSSLAAAACRAAGVELLFSANLEHDLDSAALFLYLSYSEGLGSALLLAMAAGTPVIASRVGGISEIVEHGRTGLLVENRIEAVTQAIREVLGDPEAAAGRAAEARERVVRQFSVARMVAQTEALYHLAVGQAAGRS
jgi:hypothetical protein